MAGDGRDGRLRRAMVEHGRHRATYAADVQASGRSWPGGRRTSGELASDSRWTAAAPRRGAGRLRMDDDFHNLCRSSSVRAGSARAEDLPRRVVMGVPHDTAERVPPRRRGRGRRSGCGSRRGRDHRAQREELARGSSRLARCSHRGAKKKRAYNTAGASHEGQHREADLKSVRTRRRSAKRGRPRARALSSRSRAARRRARTARMIEIRWPAAGGHRGIHTPKISFLMFCCCFFTLYKENRETAARRRHGFVKIGE